MTDITKSYLDSRVPGHTFSIMDWAEPANVYIQKRKDGWWLIKKTYHSTSHTVINETKIEPEKVIARLDKHNIDTTLGIERAVYYYISTPHADAWKSIFNKDGIFNEDDFYQDVLSTGLTVLNADIDTIVLYAYEHDSKLVIGWVKDFAEAHDMKFILRMCDI